MIVFNKIEIKDKQWIEPILKEADLRGCHYNFTNLFAWAGVYDYRIAELEGHLVVKGELSDGTCYYFYPVAGVKSQRTLAVLEEMKKDAAKQGHELLLYGLSMQNVDELKKLFPTGFEFQEMRNSFDYVYLLEKLVSLSGKKLQAKRNHINRFQANNDWSFELINSENLGECWEMNKEWCKLHGCEEDQQLDDENCAVRRCFKYYTELGLEGGLLRVDGRVIAFTMGERLNSDTYDVHVEKAFAENQGAYQMINREFAAYIQEKYPDIVYVNREEDMGMSGLRQAKLSYRPIRLEEKYLAKYVGV